MHKQERGHKYQHIDIGQDDSSHDMTNKNSHHSQISNKETKGHIYSKKTRQKSESNKLKKSKKTLLRKTIKDLFYVTINCDLQIRDNTVSL